MLPGADGEVCVWLYVNGWERNTGQICTSGFSAGEVPVVRGFVRKIPRYLFYLVGTVGCTFGTAYLLNNKISL